MKIVRVLFVIADNGASGEHLHVELDEEPKKGLWGVLWLDSANNEMPEPYYITGVRTPASRFVTIQRPEETSRAEQARRPA